MASLATKYRPRTFEQMTEQSLVVSLVKTMCESKTLPNRNFLFIGPAGCGKTTISRIIANELNEGKGEPIELDAASHGSTEDIRQIISQASTFPIGMKYKIFIIDEVHSISSQAFQVFLKTLEEQPAKSIFLFCTTNPEKIPNTILSRVQTFRL